MVQIVVVRPVPRHLQRPIGCKNWCDYTKKEVFDAVRGHVAFLRQGWRAALYAVQKEFGVHKHVKFLIARSLHQREQKKRERAFKRAKHVKNQEDWFGGERSRKYFRDHGRYAAYHDWIIRRLEAATGCSVDWGYEVEDDWVKDPDEYAVHPRIERFRLAPRCEGCGVRGCEPSDGLCGGLVSLMHSAHPVAPPPAPIRSRELLARLRAIIREFVERRVKHVPSRLRFVPKRVVIKRCERLSALPQSENVGEPNPGAVSAGNVVLTEANPTQVSLASNKRFDMNWHKLCSTEKHSEYAALLDRFMFVKAVDWKKSQASQTELTDFKLDLPCDIINVVDGSVPMFVPFKIFRYFKSDIELKFHINSNKFQVGQLQIAFQYLEFYDKNPLDNIYLRSQLPHVLINAGESNEVTLRIPFAYFQPWVSTKYRKNGEKPLYIGSIRCFVVSPLAVGVNGPDTATVSMYIRLPNAQFTGMRDGTIADPQMEAAAAAMVAGAVYDKFIGDKNCDNPTNTNVPNYLVPTAAHSWCNGMGVSEKLHNLRLDGSTIGVGRPGIANSDTSIGVACRTFGMLRHVIWSTTDTVRNKTGALLWHVDAHPQLDKSIIPKIDASAAYDEFMCPPVTVVSSLFKQWRGSLEFRFDIIASQFHTGRLIVAYIPGFYGDVTNLTLAQVRNCPYIEFSVQDSTSFTFVVPYISNSVYWPRKYTGPHKYGEISAPSSVVMFVLNPLVPMPSVSNEIRLVPYVRAGPDFEVSIPVQPALGLSDEARKSFNPKDLVVPTKGSYPYRTSNNIGFLNSEYTILFEGTAALGTEATFTKPERKLKSKEYYFCKAVNESKQGTIVYKDKSGVEWKAQVSNLVLYDNGTYGTVGIPFPGGDEGEARAKKVAKLLSTGYKIEQCKAELYKFVEDGTACTGTTPVELAFQPVYDTHNLNDSEFELVGDPEMDNRYVVENSLQPTASLPSTSGGSMIYNENFTDLKDLCRRYQLYAEKNVILDSDYTASSAFCVFPAVPHGLELDISNPRSMFNISRHGHIPIVSSGYIFFRGSLRFKIMVSGNLGALAGAKIWVQHHPDGDNEGHEITVYPKVAVEDSFRSHSYGFYVQAIAVNSIVEIEVPYYNQSMYGISRQMKVDDAKNSNVKQFFSLGNIAIGFLGAEFSKPTNFILHIYYSIADDFSFNLFRGFPGMNFIDEGWPEVNKDNKPKKQIQPIRIKRNLEPQPGCSADPQMDEPIVADPEMFKKLSESISSMISSPVNTSVRSAVRTACDEIRIQMGSARDSCGRYVKNNIKTSYNNKSIANALGNLLHILANPSPKTIAISIVNVLIHFFANSVPSIVNMVKSLTDLISFHWRNFGAVAGPSGSPQGPFDSTLADKAMTTLGGLIFTGVIGMFGCTMAPPSKFPNVMRDINTGVSLSNNISKLLSNCTDVIKYCVTYVGQRLYPDIALELALSDKTPDIKDWYEESSYLLDVRNKSKYLYDQNMLNRVFDACTMGNLITSLGIDRSSNLGRAVCDTHNNLRKLQTDLFEMGAHPDVRFEVYPLWLSGSPGIGKSYLVKDLSNRLLRHINFSQPGSLIYDIPAGAKYWSGCQNPAVLVSDDLFQVQGTFLEEEIKNIFTICSSSVLNPPMAAVEEKNRRINPLLYIMLCNHHFPNLSPTCNTPEAIYRRRKFLLQARLREDLKEQYPNFVDASQLPRDIVKTFSHIEMRYANNVKDVDTTYSEWMSYDDMVDIIKEDFKNHYMRERENFKQRMQDLYSLDPNYNETNLVNHMPGLAELPSLKEQLELVNMQIRDKLDKYNDPARDRTMWDWMRKYTDKIKSKFSADPQMYRSSHVDYTDLPFNMPEHTDQPGNLFIGDRKYMEVIQERKDVDGLLGATQGDLLAIHLDPNSEKLDASLFPGKKIFSKMYPEVFEQVHMVYNQFKDLRLARSEIFKMIDGKEGQFEDFFYQNFGQFNTYNTSLDHSLFHQVKRVLKFQSKTSWASKQMKQLLHIGQFTTLEFLHFLGSIEGGNSLIYEAVTKEILFPEKEDDPLRDDCANLEKIQEAQAELGVNSYFNENSAEYHQTIKQEAFRTAIGKIKFIDNKKGFRYWMGTVFAGETLRKPMIISHPAWNKFMKEINCANSLNAQVAFVNAYVDLMDGFDDIWNSADTTAITSLLIFLFRILALYILGIVIYYPFHHCDVTKYYNLAVQDPRNLHYCSVRSQLEYKKVPIGACKVPRCPMKSDLTFYILALAGVSCSKLYKFRQSSEKLRDEFVSLPMSDLFLGLRKKRSRHHENIFHKFDNYIAHILFHTLPGAVSGLLHFIWKVLPQLMIAVGFGLGLNKICYGSFFGTGSSNQIFGYLKAPIVEGDKQANYFKFDSVKHPRVPKPVLATKSFGDAQMSANSRVIIGDKIVRNMCKLFVSYIDEGKRIVHGCNCIMVRGRTMLVLRHYLEEYQYLVDKGFKIECKLLYCRAKSGETCEVIIPWEDIKENVAWCSSDAKVLTSNFGLVKLPKYIIQFPDIVKYIAREADHNNLSSSIDMYVLAGTNSFDMPVERKTNFTVRGTSSSSEVHIDTVYNYKRQSPGMCGSVIVSPNLGSGLGAIVGVHVAGDKSTGEGYAEPVFREMFEDFFNDYPEPIVMPIAVEKEYKPDFELDSNVLTYGIVPPKFAHKESGKSKIVPSLIQGIYPVRTEPNPLKPNDPRQPAGSHPLRDGCAKHGTGNVKPFSPSLVKEVEEHLTEIMQNKIKPVRAVVTPLTMQQVVCGDVNVPYFEPLNFKSSEGFPLSAERPSSAHDKRWLFDLDEGQFGYKLNKIHDKLQMQLDLRNKCFERNIKPNTIYIDCLKDYRLTPEKCAEPGKTRIFSIAPVQCSLDIRMHLGDFMAGLKNNRIINGISIGINPDSMEWTKLVHYLFEAGTKIITLDYSNYGPCLMSQLVAASNNVIVNWHKYNNVTDEHLRRVEWLLDSDILNPVHLSSNLVYQTLNGIASGSPLTGECNSIPNLMYIRLTYLEIMREHCPELAHNFYFDNLVRIVVYGDDLIMSVADEISETFNAITIRDYLKNHGIKVTPAQKSSQMVPYTSIYDATFLKRSFREHPFRVGVWLAPIDQQSVEECLNWCHISDNIQEATLECCRASLDLAYSHGPEYYKSHYEKIRKHLNRLGLSLVCKPWSLRDREIFEDVNNEEKIEFKNKMPWFYSKSSVTFEESGVK